MFGADNDNQIRLARKAHDLLVDYDHKIVNAVACAEISFEVSYPNLWCEELNLNKNWNPQGMDANIGDFLNTTQLIA